MRVRALIGEASCVYGLTGDLAGARRLIGEALAAAQVPALAAVVHAQDGLLLLRSGDAVAAARTFDRALSTADPENHRDLAVVHINRGAAAGEMGDLDADLRHHELALHHARRAGHDLYAAFALFNLGFGNYLRGDIPAALNQMEEAAALQPGGPDGWSEVGRAAVLLDAGLVTDAEKVLAGAVDLLTSEDLTGERGDAALGRAQCAILLRRYDEAVRWADRSRRAFLLVRNEAWALRASAVGLEALLAADRDGRPSRRATRRARRERSLALAGDAERRGRGAGAVVAVTGRLLAVEWSLLAGDVGRAGEIAGTLPPRLSADNPLPLRVHHQSVLAQVAFARADRRAGLRAVRRGQEILADHRARVGSVEAVAAAAAHGGRLARVDVEAALATGRARAVFDATERGRAAFAGAARVRPPDDPELADLLTRARRAGEEARELGASPDPADRKVGARRELESRKLQERARRRSWRLAGAGERMPTAATASAVVERLRCVAPDAVLVSYLLTDRVTALRVASDGVRSSELCPAPEVLELARRVGQDLQVLANRLIPAPLREIAATSARRSLARIDTLLLEPLGVGGTLHVAARGALLGIPWAAMPSRAGHGTWVNSWADLGSVGRPAGVDRAVVVAGPGLVAAEEEARLVAEVWDDVQVLTGPEATCAATTRAWVGAGVVHLAAHGTHEPDNPLFSSVRLADGALYAHELDGADLRGAVVVLSACEVGRSSSRIGGEPLGLTSVLLRLGARAVVAAVAPLRDDVAARVMPRLHRELRDGADAATALARAVRPEPEPVPLVCFGPL
ncbi:CHAT domain-containing protein [Isoptericola halotolerans]|uniref:Tetratricopeptide (TPR) repeat protein n=1 Tax=Isoptericola halotolerans TaxID=300560 RepID=A0ABX2A036_9MICO|nr:CHAT domain-containing protein [Isoptericola halotolerans]NOV96217.1 tetratricopeptide (TPR) repeat protein [Isoptericola halotolerans]